MRGLFVFSIFLLVFSASGYADSRECLDRAASYKEAGNYSRAIEVLLSAKTGDERVKKYLARIYFLGGYPRKALRIFSRIRQKDWLDFVYLGLALEDLGKTVPAIKNYSRSLALEKNSIALYRLGKIYYHQGAYAEAKNYFIRLNAYDSSIRVVNYYLGDLFLKEKNYGQAYSYLSKAANFYPRNIPIMKAFEAARSLLGKGFFLKEREEKEARRGGIKLLPYAPGKGIPYVTVGIAAGLDDFVFSSGAATVVLGGKSSFPVAPDKFYLVSLNGSEITIADYKTKKEYARFYGPVEIKPTAYPLYILDLMFGKNNFWQAQADRAYRGGMRVVRDKSGITLINELTVEDYLYGVLPSEINPGSPEEALKAQAVAARTFVFKNSGRHRREGFDFCAEPHCQAYLGFLSENKRASLAVDETRGEVAEYNGAPLEVFYHANCGGCPRSSFFGKQAYPKNKFDSEDNTPVSLSPYEEEEWVRRRFPAFCAGESSGSNFRWQRIYDREDFFLVFGYPLADVKKIKPGAQGECFRYERVDVAVGKEKIALDGGLSIRNYFDKLRSSLFKIEIKYSYGKPAMVIIWGAGFGHGAGLCQDGAVGMAREGFGYKDILEHYYPGTVIKEKY